MSVSLQPTVTICPLCPSARAVQDVSTHTLHSLELPTRRIEAYAVYLDLEERDGPHTEADKRQRRRGGRQRKRGERDRERD